MIEHPDLREGWVERLVHAGERRRVAPVSRSWTVRVDLTLHTQPGAAHVARRLPFARIDELNALVATDPRETPPVRPQAVSIDGALGLGACVRACPRVAACACVRTAVRRSVGSRSVGNDESVATRTAVVRVRAGRRRTPEPVNDFETPAVRIYCTSISLPSSCFGGLIQTAGGRVESFGGPLMKRSGWVL